MIWSGIHQHFVTVDAGWNTQYGYNKRTAHVWIGDGDPNRPNGRLVFPKMGTNNYYNHIPTGQGLGNYRCVGSIKMQCQMAGNGSLTDVPYIWAAASMASRGVDSRMVDYLFDCSAEEGDWPYAGVMLTPGRTVSDANNTFLFANNEEGIYWWEQPSNYPILPYIQFTTNTKALPMKSSFRTVSSSRWLYFSNNMLKTNRVTCFPYALLLFVDKTADQIEDYFKDEKASSTIDSKYSLDGVSNYTRAPFRFNFLFTASRDNPDRYCDTDFDWPHYDDYRNYRYAFLAVKSTGWNENTWCHGVSAYWRIIEDYNLNGHNYKVALADSSMVIPMKAKFRGVTEEGFPVRISTPLISSGWINNTLWENNPSSYVTINGMINREVYVLEVGAEYWMQAWNL